MRLSALLPEDLRRLLLDKKICIAVTDAHVTFHFKWNGERFIACSGDAIPDLKISAGAHDFLRLATRVEDPDTLFFNRRLVMEGDTELGLAVKNMLDALETPIFRAEHLAPAELLNTIRAGIARKRGGARVAKH